MSTSCGTRAYHYHFVPFNTLNPCISVPLAGTLQTVRDDELRRILTDANPWWRASAAGTDPTAWTNTHRLLKDRARYDLGYRSAVLDDITDGPLTDSLVVLMGPRRVGKSVTLLDAAAALCGRSDIDPRQVIHVPCDGMAERDLRRVLTRARDLTRSVDEPSPRQRVWLLDEITAISKCTSVLKTARDGADFGDDTVVVSGSRWAPGEDIEGNLLTGRAGTSQTRRIRQLLPMTFRNYLAATRPALPLPPVVHPAELQTPHVQSRLLALAFCVDYYDLAWQSYLTCGGFPRAVAEHHKSGGVSKAYMLDLAAWLRVDVDADAPAESVPNLLSGLSVRSTSPLSHASAAVDLGYASRKVFELRLDRLVRTFAGIYCPRRDAAGARVAGSQPKFYGRVPVPV